LRKRADAIERLPEIGGLPLGVLDDADYEQQSTDLLPGDTLFLFTDGITEASGPSGAQFGLKGIQASLAAPVNSAQGVIDHVLAGLHAHEAGTRPHDDQTMVALRVCQ
jgi:sigma-B regulation protein RsbU (phosphoserine phosphatase)